MHAFAETHETLENSEFPLGDGDGTIVQPVPFHRSASVEGTSDPGGSYSPTAMHHASDTQATPRSPFTRSLLNVGVLSTVQLVPSHASARGNETPLAL
jgi:hypothetical protein